MRHVTILLADDHKLVRQGVRSLLEAHPEYEIVGEASDGQEAFKLIESLQPNIAILDVMMPTQPERYRNRQTGAPAWTEYPPDFSFHARQRDLCCARPT